MAFIVYFWWFIAALKAWYERSSVLSSKPMDIKYKPRIYDIVQKTMNLLANHILAKSTWGIIANPCIMTVTVFARAYPLVGSGIWLTADLNIKYLKTRPPLQEKRKLLRFPAELTSDKMTTNRPTNCQNVQSTPYINRLLDFCTKEHSWHKRRGS